MRHRAGRPRFVFYAFLAVPVVACIEIAASAELASNQQTSRDRPTPATVYVWAKNAVVADQTYTVPVGCTQIAVKLWGAGGAGGFGAQTPGASAGGAGGFASGALRVTPGEKLTIITGQGGSSMLKAGTGAYGGGGVVQTGGDGSWNGAGGGRTAIRRGAVELMTAGGGGGGGANNPGAESSNGGAGGGRAGEPAPDLRSYPDSGGKGGTQTSGGAAGKAGFQWSVAATAGSKFTGGKNSDAGGGSGGGGWYGGGGNGHYAGGNGAGGGGGSGYCSSAVTTCVLTTGSGRVPPATEDSDYDGTSGYGGDVGGSSNDPKHGSSGRVVILFRHFRQPAVLNRLEQRHAHQLAKVDGPSWDSDPCCSSD